MSNSRCNDRNPRPPRGDQCQGDCHQSAISEPTIAETCTSVQSLTPRRNCNKTSAPDAILEVSPHPPSPPPPHSPPPTPPPPLPPPPPGLPSPSLLDHCQTMAEARPQQRSLFGQKAGIDKQTEVPLKGAPGTRLESSSLHCAEGIPKPLATAKGGHGSNNRISLPAHTCMRRQHTCTKSRAKQSHKEQSRVTQSRVTKQ